jgi:ketosteroid isomerase-like protein
MPWFPDFVGAVELARQQTRAAGQADPVAQYLTALAERDTGALEDAWPGEVVIQDPRAGEVRGHRSLRRYLRQNQSWLAELRARTERVATIAGDGRAVVELLARLTRDGRDIAWPVAVVAESPDDRSVVFRTYCSQMPITGRHEIRGPVLDPGPARPRDIAGRYQAAVAAGDAEAVVSTFAPDGYFREPNGPPYVYRGADQLRSFYTSAFSAGGGGIQFQPCTVTDDGARCALEYNCVRWGSLDVPPQAGVVVHERDPDGLLAAVRVYDDVAAPVGRH